MCTVICCAFCFLSWGSWKETAVSCSCVSLPHTHSEGSHEKSRGTKTSVFSNHTDKLEKWVAFWLGLFLNVANSFPKTSVFSNCTDGQKKLLTVI